jgi:hypothetical protein
MIIDYVRKLLAASVLSVMLVPLAVAEPPADKAKDAPAAHGQSEQGGRSAKGKAEERDDDQGRHASGDDSNHGKTVSDCNHRANERNLKGQDRKDFVEWCTDHGERYNYDARRYDQARSCYRKADETGLGGDFRRVYLQDCLSRQVK